jgi:CRP-like cAMP-binding protein
MLKKNFLTKNLNQDNILKLANAMKFTKYKANDLIIKYGDIGTQYFLLAKGCVKVLLYRDGTKADDKDLEYKIKLTKFID